MGKAIEANQQTWEQEVLKADGLVMVDFWAAWCGPCQTIAPIVEELAVEYDGQLKVAKLDTDQNKEIPSQYQVMGIPTLLFFKEGKPIDRIVGAASKKQYKEKIDALLNS